MRILIDADACPGRDIIEKVAKLHGVPVIMYCDTNHVLRSTYSEIKYIESGFQSRMLCFKGLDTIEKAHLYPPNKVGTRVRY